MKTMTCKQLGGACELELSANTFEEMAQLSQQHGMEMAKQEDADHLEAMAAMREMMQKPGAMEEWMEGRRQAFEALPED